MEHLIKKWDGTDSLMCGQLSLAMATGRSIAEVVAAVGSTGGTTTGQLISAIDKLGFCYVMESVTAVKRGRGIAIVQAKNFFEGHAVAWEDSNVFDPDGFALYHDFDTLRDFFEPEEWNITHILQIIPKDNIAGTLRGQS